ncbi:endonuclease/exonuclease/phosphatase family protein [Isoptericola sp. NEAU-Y5]|uniref:Endonuclease/exonuclease/phosphatase family protein n=1 Tax=Isoptericola luteus TaxID=2879484 RepID=A0ABS7ZF68_9MICO|nr:endonuclease/exonuclease/phosphatase family protein [Isoptericola sp. NEAU-Y5]MCA5893669.1 endonuclease/exonuclease/phosphatase family protein [Isoptericola sp. NEAU-Y5]
MPDGRRPGTAWTRGLFLAVLALGVAVLLLGGHRRLPDAGGLASLAGTFLPWLGLVLVAVLLGAALRRSATAALAAVAAAGVWIWVCGPLQAEPLAPRGGQGLVVVQHNVADTNTDPDRTAQVLLASQPDVVTLVEVTPALAGAFTAAFGDDLPHHAVQGTVGVWSRHPLTGAEPVDLRPTSVDASWDRGLRVTVDLEKGPDPRVYAVHLPSVRFGSAGLESELRDESVGRLAAVLADDDARALVVAGDLNATVDDRALEPVLAHVAAAPATLGFTFPASAPAVRIDHVLARGAVVTGVDVLVRTASDHLPVAATVALPER